MEMFRILTSKRLLSAMLLRPNGINGQAKKMISTSYNSTMSDSQVAHHSRLANVWWDPIGRMRALHAMNRLREELIVYGLPNLDQKWENPFASLDGLKVLDVGCGGGLLSESLARAGADVTSIDASEILIKVAKAHAATDPRISGKINYMRALVEDFAPANEGIFDIVVASEVLEHVANHEIFLENCAKLLKPGGSIFLTTPNKTIISWIGGVIIAEKVLSLIPKGTHHWHNFIRPEETRRLLEACGCRTNLIHGMMYNPIKNTWYWTKSTKIAYALHAVKSK